MSLRDLLTNTIISALPSILLSGLSVYAGVIRGVVVDATTDERLEARVYLQDEMGQWFFVEVDSEEGSAIRYDRQRGTGSSLERHTTISAHPFRVELPRGDYTLTVERGKEYRPLLKQLAVGDEPLSVRIHLERWIDMAELGWYSGDTHVHRTIEELENQVLAEDLNVAFPLSYWVSEQGRLASQGDMNWTSQIPNELVEVDPTHVIWPRNTEYEINKVAGQRHHLGAVFVLGHQKPFELGAPPLKPVADFARQQGALLDMDKPSWPWAMVLTPLMGVQLYELANNHVWRTDFFFSRWRTRAAEYLQPPFGGLSGDEREWIKFTLGTYYTLLNVGFPMVPTAGTANGVHPVPLGFGRVYVHLSKGFSYQGWIDGLSKGRSFVTTGPMVFATLNGREPGEVFHQGILAEDYHLKAKVISEFPLTFSEVVQNGVPVRTLRSPNQRTERGAYSVELEAEFQVDQSGWLAFRCWEDRPSGRVRYAHTAPWHIKVPARPLRPRSEEKRYLVGRMRDELERGRGVLPEQALAEYKKVLEFYLKMEVQDDAQEVALWARPAANEHELRDWLSSMVRDHQFTPEEVRLATGLTFDEIQDALDRLEITREERQKNGKDDPLLVLPYPGGRHPRSGFLDGAAYPQRETKVSVFTPWDEMSYVVVDVPEAIRSNLGLLYLAHTHVPTVWTKEGITLEPLEWKRNAEGDLEFERFLPNGVSFGSKVRAAKDSVEFEMWLHNGTKETLTDLRVQNCLMLKAALGFEAQSKRNKLLQKPFAVARSDTGEKWIITAWESCNRVWANPPVPCFHSDPQFPDCAPGETKHLRGWLWFYEGENIESHLEKLRLQRGL